MLHTCDINFNTKVITRGNHKMKTYDYVNINLTGPPPR